MNRRSLVLIGSASLILPEAWKASFVLAQDQDARVKPSGPNIPATLNEVTWGNVSVWLAEGAVAWSADAILTELFSKGLSFDSLINQVVERVRVVVRQELQSELLLEVTSRVQAVENELQDYLLAPDNLDRLERATGGIQIAIDRLDDFGVSGFGASVVARSLQLAVISERVKSISEREKEVLKKRASSSIVYFDEITKVDYSQKFNFGPYYNIEINPYRAGQFLNWSNLAAARYGIWKHQRQEGRGAPNTYFMLREDGHGIATGVGLDRRVIEYRELSDAERHFYQLVEERWKHEVYPTHILPALPARQAWERALEV